MVKSEVALIIIFRFVTNFKGKNLTTTVIFVVTIINIVKPIIFNAAIIIANSTSTIKIIIATT